MSEPRNTILTVKGNEEYIAMNDDGLHLSELRDDARPFTATEAKEIIHDWEARYSIVLEKQDWIILNAKFQP